MKKSRIHGLVSFAILEITIVISIYAIALKSLLFAAIYFIASIAAAAIILFVFCAKCNSKNNCSHVYPGQLSKVFKNKSKQKYTSADYIVTGLCIAFVFITPQFWLWSNKVMFFTFWVLIIIASSQINLVVCKDCKNLKCAMCKSNVKFN